ncbi:diphthamide biosynthesis protein 3-like isoform X2 [Peromyscus eremicus]|uniref:diphthamide biosynthesis protein 3-like isoform X2 n=1 Tax=Peromyscus eremicus TaxID=42410 RepID=UPI0027DC47BD|nr:diphthamide biosynthesis protein 3-like isoform X2 [Peromyscus eremicus]
MAVFHDEVEIEDFQYDEDLETYFYPCPCGDNFSITKDQFMCGEAVPAPSGNKELVNAEVPRNPNPEQQGRSPGGWIKC